MSAQSESEIIKKFKDSVAKGVFDENTKVTYKISGGMPSERINEEFVLSGNGKVRIKELNIVMSKAPQEVSTNLDKADTQDVFKNVELSLDRLVPRSEARFLPDSAVGSITIEVEGKQTTLFFQAEEEGIKTKEKELEPQMMRAALQTSDMMRYFKETSKRLLLKAQEEPQ